MYKQYHNDRFRWSVLNFLDIREYSTYWENTDTNSLVSNLIQEGDQEIKKSFESMLQGEQIRCRIDEHIVYNQLDDNEEAVWSLLVATRQNKYC